MKTSSLSLQAEAILLLRDREAKGIAQLGPYREFQLKYWDDPAGFVLDCIKWKVGEGPADYQLDALRRLPKSRRLSVRGPHGLGKTAMASWIILWYSLTRDGKDWKLPTTASAWRQLEKYLWPEVHKWSRALKWEAIGRPSFSSHELLDLSIKLHTGEAFALASNEPALIEGAHGDHLLYLFDEAKTIIPETWDATEGAASVGDTYMLAISTPGEPSGRFYEIQSRKPGYEDWDVIHVTKEQVIAAGRMDPKWAEQRQRQWGKESPIFINRVEGNFASSDEDGVIPLAAVERSNARWLKRNDENKWDPISKLGVDVGRGGDPSVIAQRCGQAIRYLRRSNQRDTMGVAGLVSGMLQAHGLAKAVIDVIGVGAGVVDRLRETPFFRPRVIPFNAAERSDHLDVSGELGFANMRSAGWWTLRELFLNDEIDVPPDDKLIGDLTAPHWRVQSGGKIIIESKEDIKKRLGRSTDDGDAVMMAFAPDPPVPGWVTFAKNELDKAKKAKEQAQEKQ